MNRKEQQELGYFPAGLDEALTKKFGKAAKFDTFYSFLGDTHITKYKAEKLHKGITVKDVDNYVEAFIAGNKELADRLLKVNEK